MQEAQESINAQEGVSLAIKRSALQLYEHEIQKADGKRGAARKVLSNVLKWMAGQAARQKYLNRLTPRELEILQLLVEGMPQKQIARELGLSARTVKGYFQRIRKKTNIWSTYKLVAIAVERGWVKAPKVDD